MPPFFVWESIILHKYEPGLYEICLNYEGAKGALNAAGSSIIITNHPRFVNWNAHEGGRKLIFRFHFHLIFSYPLQLIV